MLSLSACKTDRLLEHEMTDPESTAYIFKDDRRIVTIVTDRAAAESGRAAIVGPECPWLFDSYWGRSRMLWHALYYFITLLAPFRVPDELRPEWLMDSDAPLERLRGDLQEEWIGDPLRRCIENAQVDCAHVLLGNPYVEEDLIRLLSLSRLLTASIDINTPQQCACCTNGRDPVSGTSPIDHGPTVAG